MRVKARNYLFIFKKSKVKAKTCKQCNNEFSFGDLIYSKRHCKYYCKECSLLLNLIDRKVVDAFLERMMSTV